MARFYGACFVLSVSVYVLKPPRTMNYLLYTSVFNFFHDFSYAKFVKLTGWHIVVLFGPGFHSQEESGFNLSCGVDYHTLKLFLFFFISSRRMLR